MYISKIIITNFKSYKNTHEIINLDPGLNIIVGSNGSGKSNLFSAISFVLAEENSKMNTYDKQRLIHVDSGNEFLSAKVQIFLTDENNEIELQRTISRKEDEFFISGKNMRAAEFFAYLETYGLSPKNPYYQIKQGHITTIGRQTDVERYNILKQIAGTALYEEKRNESIKLLKDASEKRDQLATSLEDMKNRLNEYETEKNELDEYTKIDTQWRRGIYELKNRELKTNAEQMQQNLSDLSVCTNSSAESQEELEKKTSLLASLKQEMDEVSIEIEKKQNELTLVQNEKKSKEKRYQQLHDDLASLEPEKEAMEKAKIVNTQRLESLATEIHDKEQEISNLRPMLEQKQAKVNQLNEITKNAYDHQQTLQRKTVFATKADRDTALQNQIEQIKKSFNKDLLDSCEKDIASFNHTLQTMQNNQMTQAIQNEKKIIESAKTIEQQQQKLQREIHQQISDNNKLSQDLKNQQETLNQLITKNTSVLSHFCPSVLQAIEYLNKYCEDNKISGYYGPIIDLFSFPAESKSQYNIATEVTAGGKLFHCVVSDTALATRLINAVTKNTNARVTLLPLAQLSVKPDIDIGKLNDRIILRKQMIYDPKFSAAISYAFGNTVVCRSYEVACSCSKQNNVDCVLLDGTQVRRKGDLKGGYLKSEGPITLYRQIREAERKIMQADIELRRLSDEIGQLNSNNKQSENTLLNCQHDLKIHTQTCDRMEREQNVLEDKVDRLTKQLSNKNNELIQLRGLQYENEKAIEACKKELRKPFSNLLNQEEQGEIDEIRQLLLTNLPLLSAAENELSDLQNQISEKETVLSEVLRPSYNDLKRLISSNAGFVNDDNYSGLIQQYNNTKHRLELVKTDLDSFTTRCDEYSHFISEKQQQISDITAQYDHCEKETEKIKEKYQIYTTERSKLLATKEILKQHNYELMSNIRSLGSVPEQSQDFEGLSVKRLTKKVRLLKQQIDEKYGSLNKKALDQYQLLDTQYSNECMKKEELDKNSLQITDFISTLDTKNDKVINDTYDKLSTAFSQIFKQLIPGGEGSIHKVVSVGDTPGLSIKVSFAKGHQASDLSQLSGGQKTIVAITFLFALQKCDPAPFYLFDEIDDALDDSNREAVTTLICQEIQNNPKIQFIASTFKPELIKSSKRIYGVSSHDQCSAVRQLTKEDALKSIGVSSDDED